MLKHKNSNKFYRLFMTRHYKPVASIIILIIMLLGIYFYHNNFSLPKLILATPVELITAKKDINSMYKESSINCRPDNVSPEQRLKSWDKYLRVNKYANRAVIRTCNDSDILLAKVNDGSWQEVFGLHLDLRQNPIWQKSCLIDDITNPDTVTRPENLSIDEYNTIACQYLRKHNQIKPFVKD